LLDQRSNGRIAVGHTSAEYPEQNPKARSMRLAAESFRIRREYWFAFRNYVELGNLRKFRRTIEDGIAFHRIDADVSTESHRVTGMRTGFLINRSREIDARTWHR